MNLIRHKTPEEAMLCMANCDPDLPIDDVSEIGFDAQAEDGAPETVSGDDAARSIRAMGCWGYADTKKDEIHVWVAEDCDPALLINLLAHEIGHASGVPCDSDEAEEARACLFGSVAEQAYRMMADIRPVDTAL